MKFAVITLPYSVDTHKVAAAGPDALLQAGLADWLREQGHDVVGPFHVKLTTDEEAAYGAWNKIGFANAPLARLVSEAAKEQAFPLLLESNCYGAIGALAGLQASADPPSPRLGMILDRRSRRFHSAYERQIDARHGVNLGRSRMRESRKSGSVRGTGSNLCPYSTTITR